MIKRKILVTTGNARYRIIRKFGVTLE